MSATSYFQGLGFPCFGIHRESSISTDANPFFYGLQYIHSGHLYLSVNDGRRYVLKGPVAFLTSPDVRFSYGSPENTSRDHYFVCFEGKRISEYLKTGLFIPAAAQEHPYIPITAPASFLSDMQALILLLQDKKHYNFAVAKLEYLLLQLQNQESNEETGSYHYREFNDLRRNVVLTPEKNWDFTIEAAKMNISPKHFRRLFRGFFGMPPLQFLLHQRVLKACGILMTSLEPVKSIGYACGFPSEFYFSRIFKKYMKVSPENYRRKKPHDPGIES
ncbi:MAG: helix-turn-helix transcriptional regulator [Victivallales bacterium]|nr:helix-turn-helix transcriptional regulator [Victivallales bacterium]